MVSRSPWPSCFSWIDSPFTNVPFVLPRSTIQNCSSRSSSLAWCPLVAGSRRITSLSGERPMRTAWSPVRWAWPASGPVSIVSSPCGPAATLEAGCGLAGIAIVSANGGGAVGGGCQAGIKVVGSRSASEPLMGGGAIMVAATSTGGPTASGADAEGALHDGAGGAAGSSVLGMSQAAGDAGSPQAVLAGGLEVDVLAGGSHDGATVAGGGGAAGAAAQSAVLRGGAAAGGGADAAEVASQEGAAGGFHDGAVGMGAGDCS